MADQARYDAAHDPMDHHCLTDPCEWHPAETRIRPQVMSAAVTLDIGGRMDEACRDAYQRGQRGLAAKVEALADRADGAASDDPDVRDEVGEAWIKARDLRALLADALPQEGHEKPATGPLAASEGGSGHDHADLRGRSRGGDEG